MNSRTEVLFVADSSRTDQALIREIHRFIGSRQFILRGLLIEDEALARASELPNVKEVLRSGEMRALTQDQLAQDYLEGARRLRVALVEASEAQGFASSFDVVRGAHSVELAKAAADVDFVVLTRLKLPGALRTRDGNHFTALMAQNKSLLFVNEPWTSGRRVVVVYEGAACDAALAIGSEYAMSAGLGLVVAAPVGTHLPEGLSAPAEWLDLDWTDERLVGLCQSRDARLLVLMRSETPRLPSLLPMLIDAVSCSVLRLARPEGSS